MKEEPRRVCQRRDMNVTPLTEVAKKGHKEAQRSTKGHKRRKKKRGTSELKSLLLFSPLSFVPLVSLVLFVVCG